MPQDHALTLERPADNVALFEASRPKGDVSDRDLATDVMARLHDFQEAMDRAILAGLIVEPSFQAVGNRFSNVGVSAESFLVKVKILRRLS
jgi:hypothetical protein